MLSVSRLEIKWYIVQTPPILLSHFLKIRTTFESLRSSLLCLPAFLRSSLVYWINHLNWISKVSKKVIERAVLKHRYLRVLLSMYAKSDVLIGWTWIVLFTRFTTLVRKSNPTALINFINRKLMNCPYKSFVITSECHYIRGSVFFWEIVKDHVVSVLKHE